MNEQPSPSMHAHELHVIGDDEARGFVDRLFGPAGEWKSPLIRYRLDSDFQADWKAEVGHWLKTAERLGFLDKVLHRVLTRAKNPPPQVVSPSKASNDPHHLVLGQDLAPAMAAHYLVGTGWSFEKWEPITGGAIDVDLSLHAPGGTRCQLQVKAPDQPGEFNGHRRENGEYDERVVGAIAKAAGQLLSDTTDVNLIVVSANRIWPLSGNPDCVVTDLFGTSVSHGSGTPIVLPRDQLGRFWSPGWRHIAGVVLLDYIRGSDAFMYGCTVLLNPVANHGASADWFPRARVCLLGGDKFHWERGEPGFAHGLPTGTILETE